MFILSDSPRDCAAVQDVSLCGVFFLTIPPPPPSLLALLRWPRNVLCVCVCAPHGLSKHLRPKMEERDEG